jgi:NagD protein
VLTNNSTYTPGDFQAQLHHIGLEVPVEAIFTSAMTTAAFCHRQRPEGRVYVPGKPG